MNTPSLNLLLADDDEDDCMFFQDALKELPVDSSLKTVNDGIQLMNMLTRNAGQLPDVLFLDLNMPLKNGFECLSEIKDNEQLKALPVIIYSTSFDYRVVDQLYDKGALHYIRKPGEFSKLKKIIFEALTTITRDNGPTSTKENFVIQV